MELIRSWPHSGFSVHIGVSIAPVVIDTIVRHIGFKPPDMPPARYQSPASALPIGARVNRDLRGHGLPTARAPREARSIGRLA